MDFRKVAVWTVTIFVGVSFLMTGVGKLVDSAVWQERFVTRWGLPGWMALVTGVAELAGALLILFPRTAMYGGAIIAAVMLGATGTHAVAGELNAMPVTIVLGSLAAFVAWYRCPWRKRG